MTAKKTRYTLTAAIGNGQPGSTVELTEAQASSPLYASRITSIQGDAGLAIDIDALRDEIRKDLVAEMKESIPEFLDDAHAQAGKIIDAANADARNILAKAEADAKVIAAKK